MKAVRIHAYGHSDQVQVEDIAMPSPGTGDVLVRIHAAGVNPVDWKIREGLLASPTACSSMTTTRSRSRSIRCPPALD